MPKVNQAKLTFLLNDSNCGIIDDLLVTKMSNDLYRLVINAGNIEVDLDWFNSMIPN